MAARRKATTAKKTGQMNRLDKLTIEKIKEQATKIHATIQKQQKPEIVFPVRSLKNVKYDKKVGYFELGRSRKRRDLTVNSVKQFAQMLRMMASSMEMVRTDDTATKRGLLQLQELGRGQVQRAERVRHGHGRHRGHVLLARPVA